MKLLLAILITQTALSSASFAGTPDVDPDIAALRAQFESAGKRTREIFADPAQVKKYFNLSWDCKYKSAYKDDYTTRSYNNMYKLTAAVFPYTLQNEGIDDIKEFTLTEEGLIGTVENNGFKGIMVLRFTSRGTLVGEFSVLPGTVPPLEAVVTPVSKNLPDGFRVGIYRSCRSSLDDTF